MPFYDDSQVVDVEYFENETNQSYELPILPK